MRGHSEDGRGEGSASADEGHGHSPECVSAQPAPQLPGGRRNRRRFKCFSSPGRRECHAVPLEDVSPSKVPPALANLAPRCGSR